MISYAITVKDEIVELKALLAVLEASVSASDEIVVVWDSHNGSQEVLEFLESRRLKNLRVNKFYFENNFADLKNYLTSLCTKEYIFNIDADELLDKELLEYLPTILSVNSSVDLFYVPRINTVDGLTPEHIAKWSWTITNGNWVNFPDYQPRIYKNSKGIHWTNDVHETITGFTKRSLLPTNEMFCLKHHKKIDRQEKQNALYESILINKHMQKITFCIPSKNNLRYLKNSIRSIRENSFRKDHDIIVFVDEDKDGTVVWLEENKERYNINYFIKPEKDKDKFGVGRGYNYCVNKASTDIVLLFHADMYLAKNADLYALQKIKKGTVVSLTRIEPPLHPEGPEKIVQDFGLWPESDIEDGFKEEEFNKFVSTLTEKYANKITNGIFAPWMIYKEDYWAAGGHDENFRFLEDSDIFNRFVLNNYKFIQPWNSFVYHLTSRGWQFENAKEKKDLSYNPSGRAKILEVYNREFIRKWGSSPNIDQFFNPIVLDKYDIGIVITNCNQQLINFFEPRCSNIYVDCDPDQYIKEEQDLTVYDLKQKIKNVNEPKINDMMVYLDGKNITNQDLQIILNMQHYIANKKIGVGSYRLNFASIEVKNIKNILSWRA